MNRSSNSDLTRQRNAEAVSAKSMLQRGFVAGTLLDAGPGGPR